MSDMCDAFPLSRTAGVLIAVAGFAAAWVDPSPHRVQFVSVEKDVRLEVLDWGGSGQAMVLLAGGGNTAHVFDEFAPKLVTQYRVYGITRRGFGASGFSAVDFSADRLGDDVVTVMDALRLERAVLVGHSIAGEELSSVANRHPERVAGLVYLDAGYGYAFDNGRGTSAQAMFALRGPYPPPPSEADLSSFGALQNWRMRSDGIRVPEAELRQHWEATADGRVGKPRDSPGGPMLMRGMQKYTRISAPALFLYANPHSFGPWVNNADPAVQQAAKTYMTALTGLVEKQIRAVEEGVPAARVITLHGASHYIFLSNEQDVLREMKAFAAGLRLRSSGVAVGR